MDKIAILSFLITHHNNHPDIAKFGTKNAMTIFNNMYKN